MIGQKLGSFQIEKQLGIGAMGVVYKATNEKTGKPAAVKVIAGELATKGNAAQRFQREVEILQQFRHPNIVRFLAHGRSKGKEYFAMEFIPGRTLEEVMEKKGALPWREVVDLGIQLCEALHYAHEKGVVHRDLKPSNLMITEDGRLKLTDFGIAKDLDATALTGTGRTLGTAAYMAPEQIRGTPPVSHKTDLYSLGVVLYQMLTGQCPFSGKSAMILMHCHLTEPPPRVSDRVPEVPKALDALLLDLLSKGPTDRPWDAQAVAVKLGEIKELDAKGKARPAVVIPENPGRAGLPATSATAVASGTVAAMQEQAKKLGRKKARVPSGSSIGGYGYGGGEGDVRERPSWLGTALLVASLAAMLGFLAYMIWWPHSKAELLHRAEALMSSKEYGDWLHAREDYFPEIERRFPEEREKIREYRDKIALEKVRRRANILEKPNLLASSKPDGPNEIAYTNAFDRASSAIKEGDYPLALQTWVDFQEAVSGEGDEDRAWRLLGREKADAIDREMKDVYEDAQKRLNEIREAFAAGKLAMAQDLTNKLLSRLGKYRFLEPLLRQVRQPAPDEP